jgi:hypothetical protein
MEACRPFYVLAIANDRHDYMTNVLLTLLDFHVHNKMVGFADFLAAWVVARRPGHGTSRPTMGRPLTVTATAKTARWPARRGHRGNP